MNARFIEFERGRGQKTLFRDVSPHTDHIHLRYNPAKRNGSPVRFSLTSKPQFEIDDFHFSLSQNANSLTVTPKDPAKFVDYYIVWRFQSVTGCEDLNMNLELGPSKETVSLSSIPEKRKHVYLTVASKESGARTEKRLKINPDGTIEAV